MEPVANGTSDAVIGKVRYRKALFRLADIHDRSLSRGTNQAYFQVARQPARNWFANVGLVWKGLITTLENKRIVTVVSTTRPRHRGTVGAVRNHRVTDQAPRLARINSVVNVPMANEATPI